MMKTTGNLRAQGDELITVDHEGTTYYKAKLWYTLETSKTGGIMAVDVTCEKLTDKLNKLRAIKEL